MQPEFITIPDSFTAIAGVSGLLAVVTIFYYSFSRNRKYEEVLMKQRTLRKLAQESSQPETDSL